MPEGKEPEAMGFYQPLGDYTLLKPPVYAWRCELFGCGKAFTMSREEGKQPNWFWRWMQRLCFGNRWSRIEPEG